MRLIVTAASLSVTIAASQAFLSVSSTHAVDNVDLAYNSKTQKQGASDSFSVGEECFYRMSANSIGVDADIGILSGCSDSDLVCVEDLQSALGGRCASPTEKQRQLQITCTKCTPSSACEGLDPTFIENNIGDGSCCGEKACVGVSSESMSKLPRRTPSFNVGSVSHFLLVLQSIAQSAQAVVSDIRTATVCRLVR